MNTVIASTPGAASAGPIVDLGDHRGYVKVSAEVTAGAFLLAEVEADRGGGVPPHIHTREDETFYILEGRFVFRVGDRTIEAGPGDTVFGPRTVMHAWQCVSEGGGRALFLFTPGDNFQAFAQEMAAGGFVPLQAMADPRLAHEYMALSERYGIEMLPPVK